MVRLIAISKPVSEDLQHLTPQDLIVYIARVSNPTNQLNLSTGHKLIRYCLEHGHWSVFEQVFITMEINTTRAISAQILRHRSFTFQEFSQRYSKALDIETNIEARLQDHKNRQNSIVTDDEGLRQWFLEAQKKVAELSRSLYEEALQKGIAKEQARFLLPLSTKTRLYMTGSLRSWIHYIELRRGNGTQKEHREIAKQCAMVLREHFPVVAEVLGWDKIEVEGGSGAGDDVNQKNS